MTNKKLFTLRDSLLASGCAASVTLLAACQQEAELGDPQAVTAAAADNVAGIFESAAHAAQGNNAIGKTTGRIGDGLGVIAGSAGNVALDPTMGSGALPRVITGGSALGATLRRLPAVRAVVRPLATESLFAPEPVAGALYAQSNDSELASDLDETGRSLRRLLKERVFAAGNLENKTDSEAIYLLRPDPTCRSLEEDGTPGEIDAKCADNLAKLPLRVRVTRAGSGARFELLVGSERARPLALTITDAQIAVDLDLGGVKTTSAILARTLNQKDDTPEVLKGALRYALTKEGPHRVALAMAVTQALEVDERGSGGARITSAATDPLLSLTADGDAGTITGRIGLGQTEVVDAWEPDGNKSSGADMRVVLGGLTGAITFTEASETVKLTGLGLGKGSTYMEVRGQRIFQLDLNESDGRAYDATIDFDSAGTPRLAISPRFDLVMAWKLAAVASDFKSAPAAHLLDERYQLKLDGASGMGPAFSPHESKNGDGLRLLSGTLVLSSSKVATPVTVQSGQCLLGKEPAAGEHPVLGAFSAGPCP
jgi:hypothetical protein